MSDGSFERSARNESIFREANEKLRQGRDDLAAAGERTPFLCECEDPTCTELMLLTVEEYEAARTRGDCFLVVPEHERRTSGEVLARGEGHVLVQKSGQAGELSRALDPRRDDPATLDARRRRAAQNQSLFRSANERIESLNESFRLVLEQMDFACECADMTCTTAIKLSIGEYEAIRAHPNRFFVARGHELGDVERVVEEVRDFVLVEKLGAGDEVARNADPRGNGGEN